MLFIKVVLYLVIQGSAANEPPTDGKWRNRMDSIAGNLQHVNKELLDTDIEDLELGLNRRRGSVRVASVDMSQSSAETSEESGQSKGSPSNMSLKSLH